MIKLLSAIIAFLLCCATTSGLEPEHRALAITSPNLHEVIRAGQPFNVQWEPAAGVNGVDFYLVSGPYYNLEIESVIDRNVPNSGSYVWHVPSAAHSKEYAVMIVDSQNGQLINYSPFFVIVANAAESTTALIPNRITSMSRPTGSAATYDVPDLSTFTPPVELNSAVLDAMPMLPTSYQRRETVHIHVAEHLKYPDHRRGDVIKMVQQTSTDIDHHERVDDSSTTTTHGTSTGITSETMPGSSSMTQAIHGAKASKASKASQRNSAVGYDSSIGPVVCAFTAVLLLTCVI